MSTIIKKSSTNSDYRKGMSAKYDEDYDAAFDYFSRAVQVGNLPENHPAWPEKYGAAHYQLGLLYEEGWGTEQDDVRAINHFKHAYDVGVLDAGLALVEIALGIRYESQQEPPDESILTELLPYLITLAESASDTQEWLNAPKYQSFFYFIGGLYEQGRLLKKSKAKAFRYYALAAERDYLPAQQKLQARIYSQHCRYVYFFVAGVMLTLVSINALL